jgi:hypothetical protein
VTTVLAVSGAQAADPSEAENLGVPDGATVDSFLAAVRRAVESTDPAALIPLLSFPLRINSEDAKYHMTRTLWIQSAGELRKYAGAIFTKRFREEILATLEEKSCSTARLGIAAGRLWASPLAGPPKITAVNQPGFQWPDMTAGELLRCRTSGQLIVVDRPGERVRLRSWALGHSSAGPPDLALEAARETYEGSGVCAYPVWKFSQGANELVVRGAGCSATQAVDSPRGTVNLDDCLEPP